MLKQDHFRFDERVSPASKANPITEGATRGVL